jgi:hypothetical protein
LPPARGFPFVVAGAAVGEPARGQEVTTFIDFGWPVAKVGDDVAEAKNGESVFIAAFDLADGRRRVRLGWPRRDCWLATGAGFCVDLRVRRWG